MHDPEPASSTSQPTTTEQPSVETAPPASQLGQVSAEPLEENKEAVPNNIAVVEVKPETSEVSEKPIDTNAASTPAENEASQSISSTDEKFKEAWSTMFELLFREIATIYYPLKGMVPTIEHNIIQVKVKNESMKENFESRTRLALEYLRNNYDPRIDDIQVEVDVQTETVNKVIYDTQDKMNDLKKENPDLPEFLKILNLSAKDM